MKIIKRWLMAKRHNFTKEQIRGMWALRIIGFSYIDIGELYRCRPKHISTNISNVYGDIKERRGKVMDFLCDSNIIDYVK